MVETAICYDGGGDSTATTTQTTTTSLFMTVDELVAVVEQQQQPIFNNTIQVQQATAGLNYQNQQTAPVTYIYPPSIAAVAAAGCGGNQQQYLLNYPQTATTASYAFMSTTDFSHPPPSSNAVSSFRQPNGGVLVTTAPPNYGVPLPAGAAFLTGVENFGGGGDASNQAYQLTENHQLNFAPYPYAGQLAPAAILAYNHYQSVTQPTIAYQQTSSSSQQHHLIYATAKNNQQQQQHNLKNTTNNVRNMAAFSSDTSSNFIKASAASDTASSCSGGGNGNGNGRNSAADNVYQANRNRNNHHNANNGNNSQMRRYSDPRPSTSKQQQNQTPSSNQDTTNQELAVDSTSSVSKSSTVKSSGVDSVDSADSGLTADHSSPEHRTSTPTTTNYHHYQPPPPPMRPQTLPFNNSSLVQGTRYEAPMAENQPTTNSNSANNSSGGGNGNGNNNNGNLNSSSQGGQGLGGSRSSSPPPPPSSGDGGSNAGGTNATAGVGLGFPPVGPHAVYVHVNLGETLSVRVGNEIQHIPGPATVRMVSSHNAGPPVPLPLHVPPGHVVQQIVDENGTLRHLILSPQTPQPPAVTAGGSFPCVNIPNGPMGPSVQFVPVNGSVASATGPRGNNVHGPSPIPGAVPTPPNGQNVPVAVLAQGECPPGPSPYHLHHHAAPHQTGVHPAATVQVAPIPGHHHPHVAAASAAAIRHPLHLHTNPPHICQLHINGGVGDDGHLYPPSERNYAGKMNRGGAKINNANTNNQTTTGTGGQRTYHGEYQDQENSSPLHDTTMDDNTSAATSGGNEDEEICKIAEMLSRIPPPQVCDVGPRDALVQWQPFDCSEASASGGPFPQIDASEFTYEILLFERRPEGKPTSNYRCQADQLQQQWLANLKPSTEYFVRLRALLEERGLHGEPSSAVAFKTKPTHPDKLQPPRVQQRGKAWLQLRWQPACDNGAKITGYHLEIDDGADGDSSSFKEVYFGVAKQTKIQKLQPSTLYRLRLAASNQHGKSEFSDILLVQTTGAAPMAPEPPYLVQATSHSLTMQWKRRDGDEEFQLLMEDPQTGHGYLPVATTRDLNYVVPSLMRYKEYRFRLTSSNEDGRSPPSEIVVVRTLPARPQAPPKPHAKGRVASNNVKIAWEAPKDTGGGEITNFILDMCNENAGSSSSWSTIFDGAEHEYHVSRLEPGVSYRFRIACCTPGGRSSYSEELSLTTSPVAPGSCRPVILHGKPKATSLHLKWTAPEFRGGAEISEYELVIDFSPSLSSTSGVGGQQSISDGSISGESTNVLPSSPSAFSNRAVYQGPRTDFVVSAGLQPGRTYAFRVRAYNRAGAGPWSERFECQTASAAPDCPQRLRSSGQTSTSVSLAWDPPLSNNGAPITEYRLHQASRVISRVEVPLSIGDIRQSTTEKSTVDTSENVQQNIPPSSPAKSRPIPTVSSSHSSTASSSISSAVVAAAAPIRQHSTASSTSSTSTSVVENSNFSSENEFGTMSQIYVGHASTYEAKALKPATDYVFRIQAVNNAGFSRLSDPLFCRTPAGVPEAPVNLKTETLSLSEIFLTWDSPLENGSPILGYYVDVSPPPSSSFGLGDVVSPISLPADLTQCTVENLLPETTYRFRVQAHNEVGTSAFSSTVKAATFSPPPPPPNLELAVASHNSLKLRWNEVAMSSSSSGAQQADNAVTYTVEMENKSGAFSPVAAELASRSCKVPRLSESTVYRFRIRAFSATGGAGTWSDIFPFKTLRTPPVAVKSAPRISDVTETSCHIDWQPIKLAGGSSSSLAAGEKLLYSLQIQGPSTASSSNSDDFRQVYKGPSTSYHLNGLSHGSSYRVRVCTVRVSPADSESTKETETLGAPTPTCSFSTVSTVVHRRKSSENASNENDQNEQSTDGGGGLTSLIRRGPRQLSDRQWAVLILVVFSVVALLVAFMLQRFIPPAATTTTTTANGAGSEQTAAYANQAR